jgi:hypothetical protein
MRPHFSTYALLLVFGAVCHNLQAADLGGVQVHGIVSQGYIYSRGNNFIEGSRDGTGNFREYGMNASVNVGQRGRLGAQLFGRTYGVVGDDKPYLDWLVAEYAAYDWLVLRGGKLKLPYGLYGETRDIDSLRTGILLPQGVYVEYIRGAYCSMWGGALSGAVRTDAAGCLSYSLQYGATSVEDAKDEMTRLTSNREMVVKSIDDDLAVSLAVTWRPPLEGVRLGASFSCTRFVLNGTTETGIPFHTGPMDQQIAVVSAEYSLGSVAVMAEGVHGTIDTTFLFDDAAVPPGGRPLPTEMVYDSEFRGFYISGNYRFGDRFFLGGGYSQFVFDQRNHIPASNTTWAEELSQDDIFVSARLDVTANLVLKLEQHFIAGQAGAFRSENLDGVVDDWSVTLAKASYVF